MVIGLTVASLTIFIGFAIPLSKDENVGKYTGAQREVAQMALRNEYEFLGGGTLPYYFKFLKATVGDVTLKCSDKMKKDVELYSNLGCNKVQTVYNPSRPSSYMVTVEKWTFFGIKVDEYTRNSIGL